jgi:hypothetical protein
MRPTSGKPSRAAETQKPVENKSNATYEIAWLEYPRNVLPDKQSMQIFISKAYKLR